MNELPVDKLKTFGETPQPRFGHTLTLVNKNKAILFGGAISDSGKFVITNETNSFDFLTKKWKKLDC